MGNVSRNRAPGAAEIRRLPLSMASLAVAVASTMVMATCVLVGPSQASASVGSPDVDWWAASQLPPIESSAPGGPALKRDDVVEIECIGEAVCVAATTRPQLRAEIEPDADGMYRFIVFDMTGAGGIQSAAAEHVGPDAAWAPPAGLLEHGHEYVWTVVGADNEQQDYQKFVVDLQRFDDQPLDEVGPVSVGLGSGALFTQVGAPIGDGEGLSLGYTSPGASTLSMLPEGWSIGGEVLDAVAYTHVEAFADGAVALVHGVDGTTIRYERDDDGVYAPPSVAGQDLGFLYPELMADGGGWVVVEPWGSTSTFGADGNLARVQAQGLDGTLQADLEVVAKAGLVESLTDSATGRQLTFDYVGARRHRPPQGFDRGSADPLVTAITGFDGTVTNLAYVGGQLARVETAGATVDFAYDPSGRLVEVREALAADAVAAGVRGDDASVRWRIDYDDAGRVAQVTSPEPTPGEAPLVRSYHYGEGATTVHAHGLDGPQQALAVTFDTDDLRPQTHVLPGQAPTTYLYSDDGALLGWVDPAGMQTTFHRDPQTSTATVYGPAPAGWFDGNGLPLDANAADVSVRVGRTGAGGGMHAWFYDSLEAGSSAVALRLLQDGDITAPDLVDAPSGWRMTASGNLPVTGDVWLRVAAEGADLQTSSLSVNGRLCGFGEACRIETDAGASQALVFVDLHVPAGQGSVSLVVEQSVDGQLWDEVGLDAMAGHDLPTTDSFTDVYRQGEGPVTVVEETVYDEVAIGTVGAYLVDGQPTVKMDHEQADPNGDLWARPLSIVRPSGLTTTLEYWGSQEYATHPVTGEQLLQAGGRKTLQTGDGAVYTAIYDDSGRPVATLADGELTEAVVFDERGRVVELIVPGSGSTPDRADRYVFGADGDPLRTDIVLSVGEDDYVVSTTVDLLGRTVATTDVWGVTSQVTYDALGNQISVVTTTPGGLTTTSTTTWDARGIVEERVVAADGSTYTATVVDRDHAGRATRVVYSNGVTTERSFDPATGIPTSSYTDGDGGTWTETVTATTQTGRILAHRFDTPTTSAIYNYGYEPTSGQLTDATLEVSGGHALDAAWAYTSGYGDDICPVPGAVLDGARGQTITTIDGVTTTTTTCYDANGAPTSQHHTTDDGTHDTPIVLDNGAVVAYGDLSLGYDSAGQLTDASDPSGAVRLTRTADGSIIEQRTTTDGVENVVRYATGGLRLDQHNNPVAQTLEIGGAVVNVAFDRDVVWSYTSYSGDTWWTSDNNGAPTTTAPNLYTPDGQPIPLGDTTGHGGEHGWKHRHNGHTLDLDTAVVIFGARAYLPDLASFTTPDPEAHGGTTLYNYANGDSVNFVDPKGYSPEGFQNFKEAMDNVPPWVEPVVIGAIVILSFLPGMAWAGALAAALTIVLAGYYTYKAITAFADGDIVAGLWYTFDVFATVFIFTRLAKVTKFGKTSIVKTRTVYQYVKRPVPKKIANSVLARHRKGYQIHKYVPKPVGREIIRSSVKPWALMSGGLIVFGTIGIVIDQLDTPIVWDPWVIYVR